MSKVDSQKLKELRKTKHITQDDVAKAIGIGRTGYVRIENGERDADTATLDKLADYFGVPIDYILGRIDTLEPTREDIMKIFPGAKFDLQLFSDKGPMPPDDETIQKALAILKEMDEEHKKTALAQLEALAALNRK